MTTPPKKKSNFVYKKLSDAEELRRTRDIALRGLCFGKPKAFALSFRHGVHFVEEDWQTLANLIEERFQEEKRFQEEEAPKKGRPFKKDDAMRAASMVLTREREELAKRPGSKRLPATFRSRAISAITETFWRKAKNSILIWTKKRFFMNLKMPFGRRSDDQKTT